MTKPGIDALSVFAMPPLAFVSLAAELGCPTISIGLEPFALNPENYPAWSLRHDAALRRDLKKALVDQEVAVALGEIFVILPEMDIRQAVEADLALMADIGAPRVGVVSFDPDSTRTFDLYGAFAEFAAAAGLKTVVEFAPCFASTPDLDAALRAREHVGRDDFSILLDTMHFGRSGGRASDLLALPPDAIGYVQICDAPLAATGPDYLTEAMRERRPPGEGELPLADFVAALPPHIPYSIEIPLAAEAEAGTLPINRMTRAIAATERMMGYAETLRPRLLRGAATIDRA